MSTPLGSKVPKIASVRRLARVADILRSGMQEREQKIARASQKVYCSRTCGNAATAVARTRRKWDEERPKRLKQARRLGGMWSRTKTAEPFQTWAEEHYPDLTQKFLTTAIHRKKLSELQRR